MIAVVSAGFQVTGEAWAAGLCVAVLGCVAVVDRVRSLGTVRWWRSGASARAPSAGRARGGLGARLRGCTGRSARSATRGDPGAALASVVTEVAARLRAGTPTAHAWEASWVRSGVLGEWAGIDEAGVPWAIRRLAKRPQWSAKLDGRPAWASWQGVRAMLGANRPRQRTMRDAAKALSAACLMSVELGAPLADVLERVADGIEESASADNARRIAQSGPRMSARILMALPFAGVGIAWMLGVPILERYGDRGIGSLCALLGGLLVVGGHIVSARLIRRAEGRGAATVDPGILCDLAAAALNAGASVPTTVQTLGLAIGHRELERIGRELILGVSWRRAWHPCPGGAEVLADVLEPAWQDGVSPVPLLERGAAQLRARRSADARVEAEKLAVSLVVPLGVFLLPAFVALAVIPVLIEVGAGVFGQW